jgi:dsDNA-specific endonuclease/ATPase MutS2
MCFQIGQKVAVLDDILKGEVISVNNSIISIRDTQGMIFNFEAKELVLIKESQSEMSKFSDINHPLLKEKMSTLKKKPSFFVKEKNEVILEVDLHINQLIKSTRGMDNFAILSLQLDTARHKVEFAIQKKIPKIVFIHGVGEGVLKSELNFLLNKYPVKYYDASYKKYGLGATEVYIYQNPN